MRSLDMRTLSIKLGAVALVALLLTPLFAQRQRGGFGQPQGVMHLLNKSVQEELKLTDDQKAALKKVQDKQAEAFRKAREDKDFSAIRPAMEETAKSLTKFAKEDLKPEQAKRFRQIELQVDGLNALVNDKDIQNDLKLTDKQKEDIKATAGDLQRDRVEILKDAGKDKDRQKEAREKIQELNKKA